MTFDEAINYKKKIGTEVVRNSKLYQDFVTPRNMFDLEKYFKESASPSMAEDLTNFILDNREIKVKDVIRRKVQKNVDE